MNNEKVGFIGLGNMGHPMAKNLENAGFQLSVYNRTASRAADFASRSTVSPNISELVNNSTVIFTMLTDDHAVQNVYNEIIKNKIDDKLFIDMSTISREMSEEISNKIKNKNGSFLDAPVAGSTKPAQEGKLIIMVGGANEDLRRALPYLCVLSKKIMHLGDNGKGLAAKISINYFLAILYQGLAETVLLSEVLGIKKNDILEIINDSAAGSGATHVKTQLIINNDFQPAFSLDLMLKDARLAAESAIDLPAGKAVLETLQKASDSGLGSKDVMAVLEFLGQNHN